MRELSGDIFFNIIKSSYNDDISFENLRSWQKEILTILFRDLSQIKIIDEPIRVGELIIPDCGLIINNRCSRVLGEALADFSKNINLNINLNANKIWLSRSCMPKTRNFNNSKIINNIKNFENFLKKNEGFYILYPERFSVAEQAKMFEQADLTCGIVGSAFHTLLLTNDVKAKVIHFT